MDSKKAKHAGSRGRRTPGPRVVPIAVSPLAPEDVEDRTAARAITYSRDTSDTGVCVVDGMGLAIRVDRGALVVEDGMGEQRRTRRFDKATHGLSRLILLSSNGGYLSLEALRWLQQLGISTFVVAGDGTPLLSSAPRLTDDARLRRAQSQAGGSEVGVDIAQMLLDAKMRGQANLAEEIDQDAGEAIRQLADALIGASSIDECRGLEAAGAACHFQAWSGHGLTAPRFASRDAARIPAHWVRFDGRRSVLGASNSNRRAERPVNAILNYLYALAESEAVLACHRVGLDPGLGIVHLDTRGRQSFALDLLEPVRPAIERFVLVDLLTHRVFRKADFTEASDGHVRLMPPLTHGLRRWPTSWARRWKGSIAQSPH
jgi:CRISPR-associated endonuclease Cas1